MSTVGKALGLLEVIAHMKEEPGLTDVARAAGFDKATTRRLLVALGQHGYVEQDPVTKRYRLGPAPVRLARIRDGRYPLVEIAIPHARALSEATGETVHLAEPIGERLATIHVEMSAHANRVIVEPGQFLPFHATASGLAYLSALAPAELEKRLKLPREAFTRATLTDAAAIRERLAEGRGRGFLTSESGLEQGVMSVAAALLDAGRKVAATIAVAAPGGRVDRARLEAFGAMTADAARRIEQALWGSRKAGER